MLIIYLACSHMIKLLATPKMIASPKKLAPISTALDSKSCKLIK